MKNYYQLWEARKIKILLPALLFVTGFVEKADPRQTRVCRLPRPSTGVYKIDYKIDHKIVHEIDHEIDHKIVYENDHTIDIRTRNRLLGERPQHASFVSNGVP